ncbi:MAG: PBP1A family penicillin-binding protein [Rubrivivax sp.]|nr:PBP1A family penicillin-binding protein [Rubrivivax sp.]
MAAWYGRDLPTLEPVTDYRPVQSLQVYTADGVEIAQFGAERRQFVPIGQTPPALQRAVLAIEDTGFHEHAGISWRGLARAFVANATGGMPQGASTITQQVARTFFLTKRRTAERKIKEALLAWRIEQQLTKPQILELYLNQIYLGQRSYGFAAAAQTYFGKPLDALTLAETAMLAGLPQNPIYANPISNPARAQRRQKMVLDRLLKLGWIEPTEHAAALREKLAVRKPQQVDVHAEHVAEMARRAVVERFGDKAYTEGLRVVTSIVAADQRAAHEALRDAVLAHERKQPWRGPEDDVDLPADALAAERVAAQALKELHDDDDLRLAVVMQATPRRLELLLAGGEAITVEGDGLRLVQSALAGKGPSKLAVRRGAIVRVARHEAGAGWAVVQWPLADGAFVALDPLSGRVRALVGGYDFNRQPFNHVTQAWRQPGSAFKPFVYSAAMERGVMPDSLVDDTPVVIADGSGREWAPKNSDGTFDGPITLRQALARSKNMVSIRLTQALGVATVRDWAARYGLDRERQPDNLTLALGAGSTTPLQLAGAYSVLANGGYKVDPLLVLRITDARGRVLHEAPPPPPLDESRRVVPARNVYVTTELMGEVTRSGTAAAVQVQLGRSDLYGKTGTTNGAVDAWFAGFQPGVVAVAWIGHDEPRSLGVGESGGGLALPAWIAYMRHALAGVPEVAREVPEGLARAEGGDWRYAEWAETVPVPHVYDDAAPNGR